MREYTTHRDRRYRIVVENRFLPKANKLHRIVSCIGIDKERYVHKISRAGVGIDRYFYTSPVRQSQELEPLDVGVGVGEFNLACEQLKKSRTYVKT